MRLISCYVENYGKISRETYDFGRGITQFCKENGFGKTTLASFIKAMFYGLPSSRINAKDFDDRQHFYPFSGGKFGGNLVFETNGKTYKIERFFDKKSEKNDECRVYENGREYVGFGEDIGRAVFGIDEASFVRTVFIGADVEDVVSTGGIDAKLNRFVDDTDGENGFERAIEALDKAKKRLKATRGNNDLSSRQKEKIFGLKTDIENLQKIDDGLDGMYRERETLVKAVRELETQETKAYADNLALQKWDTYDSYVASATEEKTRLAELRRLYPQGLPTKAETEEMGALTRVEIAVKSERNAVAFGAEKTARLETLRAVFAEGKVSDEELSALQTSVTKLHALDVEIGGLTARELSPRAKQLDEKFRSRMPERTAVEAAKARLEEYKRVDGALRAQAAAVTRAAETANAPKKKSKLPLALAIVAVVLVALGLATLFVQTVVGGAMLAAGGAALVAAGFFYLKGQNAGGATTVQTDGSAALLQAEADGHKDAVLEFLVPLGYYTQGGVAYDFATFENDFAEYQALAAQWERERAILEEKRLQREELAARTRAAFKAYRLEGEDLQENLNALRKAAAEYDTLSKEYEGAKERDLSAEKRLQDNDARIGQILQRYGIVKGGDLSLLIERLQNDRATAERLQTSVETLEKRAEEYRRTNVLTERPVAQKSDVTAVKAALSEKRNALALLDRRITEAERQVEVLPEKCDQLALAEEQLEEYRAKYRLYLDTIAALTTAEETLKNKYVAPIKEKFLYYSAAIERALGEKVSMDKDFRVSFERNGENRSDKHLSAGQRSICSLCLRLALVDNMYEGEKPFIVMDDPFVNLDAEHMQKTARLVQELAADKQIVYFCCHESRNLTNVEI